MARRGGRRGRRRNRRSSSRSKASSSKSRKSKSRRTSASRSRKRARSVSKAARNRRSRTNSTTSTKKKKNVNRARRKLRNKIRSKTLKSKVKSINKAVSKNKNEKKNVKKKNRLRSIRNAISNTVSTVKKGFSMGRKAYGDAGKNAVKNVKKNTRNLGQVGRTLRNIRQPMSGLSSMAISSVLGRPGIASTIAQAAVNNLGKQNQRTRDMSKLTPQRQRHYDRLSQKTGRDYSIRNPSFRVNMNMRDIAKFAGLDKSGLYNRLPKSIRNAQVNKQFYSNPMKKGWHSSQRTGRGQGVQQEQAALRQNEYDMKAAQLKNDYDASLSAMRGPRTLPSGVIGMPKRSRPAGPQQDWLSNLYSSHNISGGKLDQEARDYWSNEAKTKGRKAVARSIVGTSKAQGTYGGRKKPQRISTGSKGKRRGGFGPWGIGVSAALAGQLGQRRTPSRKGLSKKQVGNLIAGTPRFF